MGKRGWILAVILAGLMVVGVGGGIILAHGGVKGVGGFGKGATEGESLTERVAEILGLEESAVSDAFEEAKESWDGEGSFVAEVAEILGVEESALEDALTQAKRAMANDAVRARMDAMVAKELIAQEEADEYVLWFESRPEFLDRGGWVERAGMDHDEGASGDGWRDGRHGGRRGGGEGAGHENSWKGYTKP